MTMNDNLMTMNYTDFENSWGNQTRAESYAKLEFPNTYYLAYRDLPEIISTHVTGNRAIDFGCGTGRSARFLKQLGFNVTGIDISADMLANARKNCLPRFHSRTLYQRMGFIYYKGFP
jgi:SAM-dependent methyltransferase